MQYYQRNEQALQNEKDAVEKKASEWGNTAEMLYLQNGTTMVRILPPYSAAGVFFYKTMKHNLRLGNRSEVFVCPQGTASLPCPVCAKGQELTDSRDENKMKFARENLRPRERYLYNVLCYSGPPDRIGAVPEFGKVYVMESGIMVHKKIILLDQDPLGGWADITNPESGVILMIKRTGKSQFDTTYEVNPHGGGRTNIFADCQARGIDPNSLQLVDLEQVYSLPPDWKLEEFANAIDKLVGGSFGAVPSPRPVLPVGGPPRVAAPVPVAPPVETPTPAAAPQVPQWPQAPVSSPTGTPVPTPPVSVSVESSKAPVVPPPPGFLPPQPGVQPETGRVTTSGPQSVIISAPPDPDEEIPF